MTRKNILIIALAFFLITGIVLWGRIHATDPLVVQEKSQPQTLPQRSEELPEHIFYGELFSLLAKLKNTADYQREAGLTEKEIAILEKIAIECEADVTAQDAKAEVVIKEFRKKLAKSNPSKKPQPVPAELDALQAERDLAGTLAFNQDNGLTPAERTVLDSPEVIALELTPIARRRGADGQEKVSGPFKPKSKIRFELVGTNNSILTLEVRRWDTYAQNKPRLFRDNQEVAHREDIRELLKEKHSGDSEMVSLSVIRLVPGERKTLEIIDLDNWYQPLGPGHYELSTQHRFIQGGKWVDSTAIVFEIEEKPAHKP